MTMSGQRARCPTGLPALAIARGYTIATESRPFVARPSWANMPYMPLRLALVASLAVVAITRPSVAGGKETYVFQVTRVDLADGVPKDLARQVTARVSKAIDAHGEIDGEMPVGAPDAEAKPEELKAFLKKRRQRAFKVNLEVTEYATSVEPGKGTDQVLTVRLALKMFGETIPDRVMAFTGDGSATVKVEIGKDLRPRDQEYANDQALEVAIDGAIKTSIARLREPPPSKKQPKKR